MILVGLIVNRVKLEIIEIRATPLNDGRFANFLNIILIIC